MAVNNDKYKLAESLHVVIDLNGLSRAEILFMWFKLRVMRNQECHASKVFKGHRYFPVLSASVCTCYCLSMGFCLFVICCFF